ncbi:MAG: Crp/Fnr family transcriptional regulator [Methylocystis sp.]
MSLLESWTKLCPTLSTLDEATRASLSALARPIAAPAGTRLFREDSPCEAYLILISGQIRVQKTGVNGREIMLYRVGPGETCVVTTACLMSGVDYDAEGVAETDIIARALPVTHFRDLLARSQSFRDFVFRAFSTRITGLLALIEEVAFGSIDQRLASHLLDSGKGKAEVAATHHELAAELGTAREVVSRRLKEFERKGWIKIGRGVISILNEGELKLLAGDGFSS